MSQPHDCRGCQEALDLLAYTSGNVGLATCSAPPDADACIAAPALCCCSYCIYASIGEVNEHL